MLFMILAISPYPTHNSFNVKLIFNTVQLKEFHSYFVSVFQTVEAKENAYQSPSQ